MKSREIAQQRYSEIRNHTNTSFQQSRNLRSPRVRQYFENLEIIQVESGQHSVFQNSCSVLHTAVPRHHSLHLRIQFSALLAELIFIQVLLLGKPKLEVFPRPNRKIRNFCILSFDSPTSHCFLGLFSFVCCLYSLWYSYLALKIPSCKPVVREKLNPASLNFQYLFLSLTDSICGGEDRQGHLLIIFIKTDQLLDDNLNNVISFT